MDTWALLGKELNYYGIELVGNRECQIRYENGQIKKQGIIKAIRILNNYIKKQKKVLVSLWDDTAEILQEENPTSEIINDKMISLFIFSIKDLAKYLLCFEGVEKTKYYNLISASLIKDIKSFNKYQIYSIPDYKISVDWVSRNISRLLYITKLLSFALMGRDKVSQLEMKTAEGLSGPWARLNLPMQERTFPFGHGLSERTKGKQKQRRYQKGLANYNNDGRVGEGHYWRELRNEPFSWYDRNFEDPYPSRYQLSR
jgi:hypothetical protein